MIFNVNWWLDNKLDESQDLKRRETFVEQKHNQSKLEFVEPNMDRKIIKEEVTQSNKHDLSDSLDKCSMKSGVNTSEMEMDFNEDPSGEPILLTEHDDPISDAAPLLHISQQQLEVNEDQFSFLLSHVSSPGEIWVQPVQQHTFLLQEMENLLAAATFQPRQLLESRRIEVRKYFSILY